MPKEKLILDINEAIKRYEDFLLEKNTSIYDDPYYINLLELTFSAFLFILNKESIRLEGEHDDNYLASYITEQIISFITTKKDNKYYINNQEFNSINEIIKLIRDKIAHGAFTINEDGTKLIIDTDFEPITIDKQDFVYFVVQLIMRKDLYSYSDTYHRFHVLYNQFILEHVSSQQDIDKFLSTLQICELRFTSNRKLSPQDKDIIEKVLHNIKYTNVDDLSTIDEKLLNGVLQIYKIKTNISRRPIKDTKFYTAIKEMIIDNLDEFITYSPFEQSCLVTNWIHKSPEYLQREIISQGLFYNIDLLQQIKSSTNKSYIELLNEKNMSILSSSHNERLLATSLINFYILYQYPLEDVFARKDNVNNEDYFDYSKLNLSSLKPEIFEMPKNRLDNIDSQINSITKKVEGLEDDIIKLQTQMNNISRLLLVETDGSKIIKYNSALENLDKNIRTLKAKIVELLLEKERVSNVYKEFQTSPYYTNRYMIEYIRNAISHGKVYYRFNENTQQRNTQQMMFINRDNRGEVSLRLNASLSEFNQIFNDYNTNLLVEHINLQEQPHRKID